ncbi:MAG: VPLPA-CTERM-specific exosortase XrtD [Gammaproteobacteria bacterium]|nr:MAG: VPLPA-CTERM-specific exosortase XrtD [Gammaproteobacteria bacterium]
MSAATDTDPVLLRPTPLIAGVVALALAAIAALSLDGLEYMWTVWLGSPEFSHGPLIPLVAAFLTWQQKGWLARQPFTGSWSGVALCAIGALVALVGKLGSVFTLGQIGALLAFWGLILAFTGWTVCRRLWAPLVILGFMIPLPDFVLSNLSSELQLLSSSFGVWFMRLFGVSVFLEGNVIDLGGYRLQVAEACDGLRYLFPLMTLGFIMAVFFQAALWKRLLLFLSSIPITLLMNSLRVGTIGIMVEHWGIRMAEGFLHEFQGWAVFMLSAALMLLEMAILARIGREGRPWREVFGLEFPAPLPKDARILRRPTPPSLIAATVVLVLMAGVSLALPERTEVVPARQSFVDFPLALENWEGRRSGMEQVYLDQLQLDDYLMADYRNATGARVNLYVAWYDSQQAGRSAHSPRTCLPGGGWQIREFGQVEVEGVALAGTPLRVNRAVIALGPSRQLVYYWFQQRGRVLTNEYLVKWFLFWDSLTRNRSDGALVRLIVPLAEGQDIAAAESELTGFARAAVPLLPAYVP